LKLLITGASGLVGARLSEAASHVGHEVIETYDQHEIDKSNAFRVDIKNRKAMERIMKKTSPDATIHLASITDVDLCEREPELANSVNANATRILAEECLNTGSHFVYVSTDYVFDGRQGNYTEQDQPNPINTYGLSKLRGEEATHEASATFCVARTSVVYGWGRRSRPNFGSWTYSELKAGRPIRVVEAQYCSPTLNSQLAVMLLEVAEKQLAGIIHLAGASRLSRYQFALEMADEFHLDKKLIIPTNAKSSSWVAERPLDSSLNVEKAQKLLSNKPVTIKDALRMFAQETES
jgi:dTDP-4-dehydrorhamnose reductase